MADKSPLEETITFLGTGGARFMIINQFLASGGLWLNMNGTEALIDPGPGCIVQATKRKLKPEQLSAIILSHRHLDHAADANIMVEAMTQGGFQRHGQLFLPADAIETEPVIFSYLKEYLDLAGQGEFLPQQEEELQVLLDALVLEKAVYELGYELNNRPDWVKLPLRGILQLLDTSSPAG